MNEQDFMNRLKYSTYSLEGIKRYLPMDGAFVVVHEKLLIVDDDDKSLIIQRGSYSSTELLAELEDHFNDE